MSFLTFSILSLIFFFVFPIGVGTVGAALALGAVLALFYFGGSSPAAVDDPLTAYDEWLKSIKTPGAHRASVVFCTYWLAKEITGLTVSKSIVDTYGASTRATAETIADFIRDCAVANHKHWWDCLGCCPYTSYSLDGPVEEVPGIGPATAEVLRKNGRILTVRHLINKFNSFSGRSINKKYQ